jgi:hypothetical protein
MSRKIQLGRVCAAGILLILSSCILGDSWCSCHSSAARNVALGSAL